MATQIPELEISPDKTGRNQYLLPVKPWNQINFDESLCYNPSYLMCIVYFILRDTLQFHNTRRCKASSRSCMKYSQKPSDKQELKKSQNIVY